jgi:hypothetical protein
MRWTIALFLLVGAAGCASDLSAPAPELLAPARAVSSPVLPLPRCVELDWLRVEAYWSPLPWHGGERWVRIESVPPSLSGRSEAIAGPTILGCASTTGPDEPGPGTWVARTILIGCVPADDAKELELTLEIPCRFGEGRRTFEARIVVDRARPAGERLPVAVKVSPPTPPEELSAGTELDVWRSRDVLPVWIARAVPADFDFERFMLCGPERPDVPAPVVVTEVAAPLRANHVFLLEQRFPRLTPCECRGVQDATRVEVKQAAAVLWKLPRAPGKCFLRTHVEVCPPCSAP